MVCAVREISSQVVARTALIVGSDPDAGWRVATLFCFLSSRPTTFIATMGCVP